MYKILYVKVDSSNRDIFKLKVSSSHTNACVLKTSYQIWLFLSPMKWKQGLYPKRKDKEGQWTKYVENGFAVCKSTFDKKDMDSYWRTSTKACGRKGRETSEEKISYENKKYKKVIKTTARVRKACGRKGRKTSETTWKWTSLSCNPFPLIVLITGDFFCSFFLFVTRTQNIGNL